MERDTYQEGRSAHDWSVVMRNVMVELITKEKLKTRILLTKKLELMGQNIGLSGAFSP